MLHRKNKSDTDFKTLRFCVLLEYRMEKGSVMLQISSDYQVKIFCLGSSDSNLFIFFQV